MTRITLALALAASITLAACDKKPDSNNAEPAATGPVANSATATAPAPAHTASGKIEAVDPVAGTLKINHGPVPSLSWPAMTMDFSVSDKNLLNNIKSGQQIEFEFVERGSDYVVTAIR